MVRLSAVAILVSLAIPLAAVRGQETRPEAAKVAGTWDFSFTGPQGAMTWRMKFEQAGDTVRGQAESELGLLTVNEGWVSGNELSFGLPLNYQGQSFTVYFTGIVKGDTADGSLEVPNSGMQAIPFRAVRVTSSGGSPEASDRPFLRLASFDLPVARWSARHE